MYVRTTSKKKTRKSVKAGTYTALVKDVYFDEEYVGDGAFKIVYELIDAEGNKQKFDELFYDNENPRRNDLLDYLEENKIRHDNLSDFIGCTEEVVIKKLVRDNTAFPSIVERNFISHPDEGDTDAMATK